MKNFLVISIWVSFLLFMTACDKEETIIDHGGIDLGCEFVQNDEDLDGLIDETERSLLTACLNNQLEPSEIPDNLVGNWELIGHGEGWIPTISQPCAFMNITADELTLSYEDARIDTTITSPYTVDISNATPILVAEHPLSFVTRMTCFSADHMFNDATVVDGNMYLWEKL